MVFTYVYFQKHKVRSRLPLYVYVCTINFYVVHCQKPQVFLSHYIQRNITVRQAEVMCIYYFFVILVILKSPF